MALGKAGPSDDVLPTLKAVTRTLDDLNIAACLFDDADRTLLWNRSFLTLFPEHAADLHVGEPYSANLRRFYEGRLNDFELPMMDRYIAEGLARHRLQNRPFAFDHRGLRVTAASLPVPGIGRIRIWKTGDDGIPGPDRATARAMFSDGLALFDHVADGVMVTAPSGDIAWVNQPFVLMYGLRDQAAAMGSSFQAVYAHAWQGADETEPFQLGMAVLTENLRFFGAPFELPLPEGRWARVVEQRSPDGKGFCAHVDITALKRQQLALQLAEARLKTKSALLEATLARMDQGIMMVNAEGVVEVCNRRAIELLGLSEELMASHPHFSAVLAAQWAQGEFANASPEVRDFVLAGGILDHLHSYDRQRPDGRTIEIHSVPIEGGGVLRTYTDITERKRNEERVRHAARHDGLTALVNRESFLETLGAAVQGAAVGAAGFAVHYIDLDGFKLINDRWGHAVGDKALALVAERMRGVARDADVVARMGGDEFAILQYGGESSERARRLAQRVLDSLAQPVEIESRLVEIGASIGIALYPGAGCDPDSLLRNADSAMYAAKAEQGNCVRFFEGTESRNP